MQAAWLREVEDDGKLSTFKYTLPGKMLKPETPGNV